MRRKKIRDRTKLAALACLFLELPHEEAKRRTEDEVIALLGEWDHYPIRKADGGPDSHWNLRPLFAQDHLKKTKADAKDMAKERKVRRAAIEHIHQMRLKAAAEDASEALKGTPAAGTPEEMLESYLTVESWPASKKRWPPSRPFPSRPFPKRRKK